MISQDAFLSEEKIHEYLDSCPMAYLRFALLDEINKYLLGDYGEEFNPEKFKLRRSCYYQSYSLYEPYAFALRLPWWKRLYWKFKKVDHPDSSTPEPLLGVVSWFELQGKTFLYNHLSDGSYRAYGFIDRRDRDARRVPIPFNAWGCEMLEDNIDWVNSTVKGDGVTYVGVQIVSSDDLLVDSFEIEDSLPLNAPSISSKPSKPGRPTARAEILQAYHEFCAEGKIDFSKSLKYQTPMIQERVRSLLSEEDRDRLGYEYEAIRRLVKDHFNARRPKKKKTSKL